MATSITARGSDPGSATPDRPHPVPPKDERRQAWRSRLYRWDTKGSPYAFVSPFFLVFAAFGLFPLLYTGWLSLHQVSLYNVDQAKWVGLKNYTDLFTGPPSHFFWNALGNTFTLGILSTVPQLMIAIGLAHLLNYKLRASSFFRTALLAPYATSVAAATLVFALIFSPESGMANWFLGLFGVDPVAWEAGEWTSQLAISLIVTWRWTGYNALIFLAAMQAVPGDLYEAAALDGASRWKQFLHVTVPALRPTILFTVVVSTIGATQLFGEPFLFGGQSGHQGGTAHQYETLGVFMYDQGFRNSMLGRASAIAWTMFALLLLIGLVNALIARRLRKSQ
ncbi:ABC transporter permease [Kitasatospora herbaricolor]|uniref:carbohydrate ABC transporter permease n=1 Tax=Kitasatospora herbaricolor TaxID=68217 RepID=UPI0017498570|nr:cellobiose transport system permease protein [Kitasatospora herbaricolor]GGV22217.1 ABC transporter permease [Kitasatospora herbaricolor]